MRDVALSLKFSCFICYVFFSNFACSRLRDLQFASDDSLFQGARSGGK